MIGDTAHDLEMASHAGTAAVGVLSGSHGSDLLVRATPLAVLDSVRDLPAWLGKG